MRAFLLLRKERLTHQSVTIMDLTKAKVAQAYLAIPNAMLQALGGAHRLRKTIEASQFEILHAWPSFSELPYGISFRFQVGERCYSASFRTSVVERDFYCLDIRSDLNNICEVSDCGLTLDVAAAQFFEFVQATSLD
ncbi:MAG: hypothetical protein DCF25_22595 [Leptolyngbya foveolarum]|uniref:Uncharacterized protein n=1 Tax=Leptolyngbya foveolarum TaxID=47253 RepID=A0A2W4TJX3_9CYAN|nr:MAG: hypothetical protein DCF25_22595 [Leptolyngbya foveolarum]